MSHKMRAYDSFDHFTKSQSAENRKIVGALRKLVNEVAPKLEETVKWGNGCWQNDSLPVAYAHCEGDHVQFGFFGGSLLKDTKNMLEGGGKYVRHVKIRSPKEIDAKALTPLIRQAARTNYKG
jgi:hypothetical protein